MSTTLTVYVVTPDLERMRRFYEEALGVKAGAQSGNWMPFRLAGATFALHAAGNETEEELKRVNLSFGVDDIDGAVARFQARGAQVLRGVADETFGKMATLGDPDGRTFELVQHEVP